MSTRMSKEERGDIAVKLLKVMLGRKGLTLSSRTRNEIGDLAKEAGIDFGKACIFIRLITMEMLNQAIPDPDSLPTSPKV